MVRATCGHMELQDIMEDREIRELSQNTSIESLSRHWMIVCLNTNNNPTSVLSGRATVTWQFIVPPGVSAP